MPMPAEPKKVTVKNPLKGRGFKARYCAGDRTDWVVKAWNRYVRARKKGQLNLTPKKGSGKQVQFDPSKLTKPINEYTPRYLYSLGCRDAWVMKAVAEEAKLFQRKNRLRHQAAMSAAGVPTVKTWKEGRK